ncbi:MAG: hypothetical protein ACFCU7_07095 [Pleurocapsa sp.]
MKTFLDSPTSLSSILRSGKIEKSDTNATHLVGVFSNHRDVKVALEDLRDEGFPSNLITLIARNCQRYSWLPEINTTSYFNQEVFSFNQVAQNFFQRLFRRGKYLVLVKVNEQDVTSAGSIMGRRRGHAEVWHCE